MPQVVVGADVSGGDVAVASGAGHVIGEDNGLTTHNDTITEDNGDKTAAPCDDEKVGHRGATRES